MSEKVASRMLHLQATAVAESNQSHLTVSFGSDATCMCHVSQYPLLCGRYRLLCGRPACAILATQHYRPETKLPEARASRVWLCAVAILHVTLDP